MLGYICKTVQLAKNIICNSYQFFSSLLAGFLALLVPAYPALLTVFAFIVCDTYYGYKVSKRFGHKFESGKLWKMCDKITEAFVVISLGIALDKSIFMTYPDDLMAVKFASGVICIAEAVSLLEAFRALHPHALLSKLLAKLIKSKAEKYLDVDLSDVIDLNDFSNDTKDNKTGTK